MHVSPRRPGKGTAAVGGQWEGSQGFQGPWASGILCRLPRMPRGSSHMSLWSVRQGPWAGKGQHPCRVSSNTTHGLFWAWAYLLTATVFAVSMWLRVGLSARVPGPLTHGGFPVPPAQTPPPHTHTALSKSSRRQFRAGAHVVGSQGSVWSRALRSGRFSA